MDDADGARMCIVEAAEAGVEQGVVAAHDGDAAVADAAGDRLRAGIQRRHQVVWNHVRVASIAEQAVAQRVQATGVVGVDLTRLGPHGHPAQSRPDPGRGVARARPAERQGTVERHSPEIELARAAAHSQTT
jgi:hypothetical protein